MVNCIEELVLVMCGIEPHRIRGECGLDVHEAIGSVLSVAKIRVCLVPRKGELVLMEILNDGHSPATSQAGAL